MTKKKWIILIIYSLFGKYVYNKFNKVFTRWLLLLFIICIALPLSTKIIFWTVNEKWILFLILMDPSLWFVQFILSLDWKIKKSHIYILNSSIPIFSMSFVKMV